MPSYLKGPSSSALPMRRRRWTPVNSLKNAQITVILHCSWSGERHIIPEYPPSDDDDADDAFNYFDESPSSEEVLLGSTTLHDLIQRVKSKIPALYLWDEVGGQVLVCGKQRVFSEDWETTLLCHLVGEVLLEDPTCVSGSSVPKAILEDGREAVVVTLGTPESVGETKASLVTRCLKKGDVYG
ncbi:hypothetical protein ACHAXS_009011 [Conticribra weissflogii]